MLIINVFLENILRYLYVVGIGMKEVMKSVILLCGILEWFVNFFICGGVRRSNERCF